MASEKLNGNIDKVSTGMVQTPKRLLALDLASAAVDVGEQISVIRVRVTALTYLAFGKTSTIGAVSVTTKNAIELSPGTHMIAVTGRFVRTSIAVLRAEAL